jgi:hypothetical protein
VNDYLSSDPFCEVVDDKSCIHFLKDEMHSAFFELKCSIPTVYLRLLKEVSIPQRMAYSSFSFSGGY